jgi:hypothetical protein
MTLIPGTTFSDNDDKKVDFLPNSLTQFIQRIADITQADLKKNHSIDQLFANTVEELGEYAAAKTVESGGKDKELKESSLIEAADLSICSLSLFFANGGNISDLVSIGNRKLNKWDERLKKQKRKK